MQSSSEMRFSRALFFARLDCEYMRYVICAGRSMAYELRNLFGGNAVDAEVRVFGVFRRFFRDGGCGFGGCCPCGKVF